MTVQPGNIVINVARDNVAVFRILTAVDSYGSCKAARLGGKRASKVTLYPAFLPPHLKVVSEAHT